MEPAKKIIESPAPAKPGYFQFGEFRFFPETLELYRLRKKIPLKVQSAKVLKILLEGRGALVSREAIIHEIWSDRVVEFDLSLNACIRDIRTALGDTAHDQNYIETLSKRGYRFNPKTQVIEKSNGKGKLGLRPPWVALAAIAGLVLLAIFSITQNPLGPARTNLSASEHTEAARTLVLGGVAAIYDQDVPDYPKAIALFQEAIAADPGYGEAHMMLARTVFARGTLDQIHLAETSLDAILTQTPDNIDALSLRGSLNWTINHNWQAARTDYEQILTIDPNFNRAYVFLASYYSVMGDFDQSLRHINLALTLNTVQVSGNGNVGWFYYLAGRQREAIRFCDETHAINPDGQNTRRCYLNNLITLGEVDQAAVHALGYLKLHGVSEDELSGLEAAGGRAVIDFFTAFEAGTIVPENDRGNPAFLYKAIALTRMGDRAGAIEIIRHAFAARNYFVPFIRVIPELQPLYDQKDFQDVVTALNFPGAYQANS